MSEERRLRFKIRRGDYEVELEGEFEYVKKKFEEFLESLPSLPAPSQPSLDKFVSPEDSAAQPKSELQGIVELNSEGEPRLTLPVDSITAKEALALILYAAHPKQLTDDELSGLLSSCWKTMRAEAIRARASELRREGKLVAEKGAYNLSGAGIQWIREEVTPRLRRA